jgi:hypothetical protein
MRAAQRAGFDRVFASSDAAQGRLPTPRGTIGSAALCSPRCEALCGLMRTGMGLPCWPPVQCGFRREMEAHSCSRGLTGTAPGGNTFVALIHRQLWPLSMYALRARGHFRSSRLQCHSGAGASQVAALLSCGIFERGGALLGSLSGSAQSSRSAGRIKVDIVDSTVTPHGPEQAS